MTLVLENVRSRRLLCGPNLDDKNHIRGLNRADNAPILHTQPAGTLEAVSQWLSKLDRAGGKSAFDRLADLDENCPQPAGL